MIIAISGKKQSGKDTVGKIIQYLTSPLNKEKTSFKEFEKYINKRRGYHSDWQIKKYADKLKDIVCLLINCTREQLEDEEFKNTELGKYWTIYYNNRKQFIGVSKEEVLSKHGEHSHVVSETLTPRKLLQLLGTDCGRDIIHPDIWVNSLMSNYVSNSSEGIMLNMANNTSESIYKQERTNWIITDTRFPNELEAVKARGGISIRVNRYPETVTRSWGAESPEEVVPFDITNTAHKLLWQGECARQHESETALDNAEFDYVITNEGSLEELIKQTSEILIKENIL